MKQLILSILIIFLITIELFPQAVKRLPADSAYRNRTRKTMWVVTDSAINIFTVNLIQNKYCQRIKDSLTVQTKLMSNSKHLCDTALTIRTTEALMWHNKLDSNDKKLQKTEIDLSKEKKCKKNWVKATFINAGAALIFVATTIIFIIR